MTTSPTERNGWSGDGALTDMAASVPKAARKTSRLAGPASTAEQWPEFEAVAQPQLQGAAVRRLAGRRSNNGVGSSNSSSSANIGNNPSKRRWPRVVLIVAAALVVVALLLVAFAACSISRGESSFEGLMANAVIETGANAVSYDEGKTVYYNGHTYVLNEDMVSVLVIGIDRKESAAEDKPVQADAVIVVALDKKTGQATAISIPRDSMVEIGRYADGGYAGVETAQLCLSYGYGDGYETSCEYTTTAVSRTLYNMPINYYFTMDQAGIGPMNDAIGGVTLTPLQTIPKTQIVEGQETTLLGTDAYNYLRWRDKTVLTSSLDRQDRQIQYVKAFAKKTLGAAKSDPGLALSLYNQVSSYSITNMGMDEFSYLASVVMGGNITGLDVISLPGEMVQGEKYAEFYLDKTAVYETILDVYYTQVD
ncbi:MAG: LCP family protein [Coriobacteriales bacterium]|jgi:LCP family protein required for cell wall assembly|nr:LCP family protein [Coriobacteriales bacterium]